MRRGLFVLSWMHASELTKLELRAIIGSKSERGALALPKVVAQSAALSDILVRGGRRRVDEVADGLDEVAVAIGLHRALIVQLMLVISPCWFHSSREALLLSVLLND